MVGFLFAENNTLTSHKRVCVKDTDRERGMERERVKEGERARERPSVDKQQMAITECGAESKAASHYLLSNEEQ